jgi:hypothetical protein
LLLQFYHVSVGTMPTDEDIRQLFEVHNSPERRRHLLMESYGFDSTSSWKDSRGYVLSDRIWRARRAVRDQIDAVLRNAIAQGTDALEVAEILEQFLSPDLAPVRNQLGRLIRNQRKSIVTRAPGRGGMGSFSARRLIRSEMSRAHAQSTLATAERTPFSRGCKWNLSAQHPKPDICDRHANADDYGLGRGVYPPDRFPPMPSHPMDLCFATIETETDIDSVLESLRTQYGLDE